MKRIPRMNLHLRLQHGMLLLSGLTAFITAAGLTLEAAPKIMSFDLWYLIHKWSGLTAALVLLYHVTYLFVRGYVEGKNWPDFPMTWKKSDWEEFSAQARFVVAGEGSRPEAGLFRSTQKLLYWICAVLITGLLLSGVMVSYWESFGGSFLPLLGGAASFHRGLSLLLLALIFWHLYGVFAWDGRWAPQWAWLTGTMTEELARSKVPGFYREYLKAEKARLAAISKKSDEEEEEEDRQQEKEDVEKELQEGNRLAKEEQFVDALYHYRRALERYPGYSQARFNMAVVLMKMGERAMAAEQFAQFVNDDPFHPLARRAQEFLGDLEKEAGP